MQRNEAIEFVYKQMIKGLSQIRSLPSKNCLFEVNDYSDIRLMNKQSLVNYIRENRNSGHYERMKNRRWYPEREKDWLLSWKIRYAKHRLIYCFDDNRYSKAKGI